MLIDRRIKREAPKCLQTSDRVRVIQTGQAAVPDQIKTGDGNQLSLAGIASSESRFSRQ